MDAKKPAHTPYTSLVLQSRLTPWLARQPGVPVGVEVLALDIPAPLLDGEPLALPPELKKAFEEEVRYVLSPKERDWARLWGTDELTWPEAWVQDEMKKLPELKKARFEVRQVGVRPVTDVLIKLEAKNPIAAVEAYEGVLASTLERLGQLWEQKDKEKDEERPLGQIYVPMPGRVAADAVATNLRKDFPDWLVDVGDSELAVTVPQSEPMADALIRRVIRWY